MSDAPYVDPTAIVHSEAIGRGSKVWQYTIILKGARVGEDCNICSHVFIESDVIIGSRVTIKAGVQLWNGMVVEDDVFIGPNATFSNDRHPRSGNRQFLQEGTILRKGCSIGAGAVVLPGVEVGADAIVGAGAVVTKDVPPASTVVGNPARLL